MHKFALFAVALVGAVFLFSSSALAHVTVKPGDVKTGTFQTFNVSVPNEKGGDVVEVKLEIPEGLSSVRPNVKPGWNISVEREGENQGEEVAKVKSITWTGGKIGDGLRDEFLFSARTPAEPTELQWKAYETYANGVTIAWDASSEEQPKKEDGSPDFSQRGPFSVTKVTGDEAAAEGEEAHSESDVTGRVIAGVAAVIALAAFAATTRGTKPAPKTTKKD